VLNLFLSRSIIARAANAEQNLQVALALFSAPATTETLISTSISTGQSQSSGPSFNPIQFFAPAMAIFFLNFLSSQWVIGLLDEKSQWTLQRMLIAPTQRPLVLLGKFGGTYINGVIQLSILIVAMTLVAPLFGVGANLWGNNALLLPPTILLVTLTSVGLGTLLAGVAKSRQQAGVIANAVLVLSGLVGGTFFGNVDAVPGFGFLSRFTLNYWAQNAFTSLTQGQSPFAAWLALLLMAILTLSAGLWLFNKRVAL
jgi:ABC-type multidrug transport system permease subunit